jgi:hypothetical protein
VFGCPGTICLSSERAALARPWPAKAQVLAGPYPLATAGTPRPESFDPANRVFGFTYMVDRHMHAPTEIVVPAYSYPLGYVVAVQGAAVTSAPNASPLTLRALPGSHTVAILIGPPAANVGPGLSP